MQVGGPLGQQQIVQVDGIGQAAHGQGAVVGILDAEVQHEVLAPQPGADQLHAGQFDLGLLIVAPDVGTTAKAAQQDAEQGDEQGLAKHAALPFSAQFNKH